MAPVIIYSNTSQPVSIAKPVTFNLANFPFNSPFQKATANTLSTASAT